MLDSSAFRQDDLDSGRAADEPFPLDPSEVAEAIEIPLSEWPGNCHGIAVAIRDRLPVRGMRLARGMWNGLVSRKSVYRGGPAQHSWLVLSDGRILDPTRWAMERPGRSEIYLGVCDCYDEGGRESASRRPPPFPGAVPPPDFSTHIARLSVDDIEVLLREFGETLGGRPDDIDHARTRINRCIQDLVALDPTHLEDGQATYRAIERIGLKALIPIDSWQRVCEPEALYCRSDANRYFALPDREEMSEAKLLLTILLEFLLIEHREGLEEELDEYGYSLDEWHDALNVLERMQDFPLRLQPRQALDTIAVVSGDLLGKGFGKVLAVERFAASLGLDRRAFDALMQSLSEASGYDCRWL